jgi:hypothetical protein
MQDQIQSISHGLLIDLYKKKNSCFFLSIDLGSIICLFTVKQSDLEIPIMFVSWRGRTSLRPFVSHSSRKFYFSLCNVDATIISKNTNTSIPLIYWIFF